VCCAAALANLEVLTERETWLSEVDSKGTLFKELLQHNQIKEVRQIGLMMAVELNSPDEVDKVIARLLEEGIIGFYFLSTRNAFRLAPPLCISNEEIEWASSKILKVMEEL